MAAREKEMDSSASASTHDSDHEGGTDISAQPTRNAQPPTKPADLRRVRNPHHIPPPEHDNTSEASIASDEENGEPSSSSPCPAEQAEARLDVLKSIHSVGGSDCLRKLDRRLVLFLALLYLLSFLDRSNIGNARIAGLEKSLSLSSNQFDWLLTAFYITYIAFEWMILLYKLLPPHAYIACCVVGWGIVASLQALTTSFPQLIVLRGCLGITEAAFGPGVPFYMTFFYRRRELAYRVGLQISAAPLATSFASSLAWVIIWINRKLGEPVESWRMLFLVEGFPSVLVGVLAWYWIPDSPSSVRWLTPRERKVAVLRMQDEADHHHTSNSTRTTPTPSQIPTPPSSPGARFRHLLSEIVTTLHDPKCYLHALLFFSVNVSFASLPVFLPTIINSLAFSPLASQALAAPPYLAAFIFVLLIAHHSDRIPDSRGVFLACTASLSAASYLLIALFGLLARQGVVDGKSALSIIVRYVAIYPAAMGMFSSVTLIIAWTLNNQESRTGKGVAMTVLNVVGQCGPLVGVRLFPRSQGPEFVGGMLVSAVFMAGVALGAVGLRVYLGRLNERVLFGGERGGGKGVGVGEEVELEIRERLMGGEGDGEGEGEGEGDETVSREGERGRQLGREMQEGRFRFIL